MGIKATSWFISKVYDENCIMDRKGNIALLNNTAKVKLCNSKGETLDTDIGFIRDRGMKIVGQLDCDSCSLLVNLSVVFGTSKYGRDATFFDYATAYNSLNPCYSGDVIVVTDYLLNYAINKFMAYMKLSRVPISLAVKTVQKLESFINRAKALGNMVVTLFEGCSVPLYLIMDNHNKKVTLVSDRAFRLSRSANKFTLIDINRDEYFIIHANPDHWFRCVLFNTLDIRDVNTDDIDVLYQVFDECTVGEFLHNIDFSKIKHIENFVDHSSIGIGYNIIDILGKNPQLRWDKLSNGICIYEETDNVDSSNWVDACNYTNLGFSVRNQNCIIKIHDISFKKIVLCRSLFNNLNAKSLEIEHVRCNKSLIATCAFGKCEADIIRITNSDIWASATMRTFCNSNIGLLDLSYSKFKLETPFLSNKDHIFVGTHIKVLDIRGTEAFLSSHLHECYMHGVLGPVDKVSSDTAKIIYDSKTGENVLEFFSALLKKTMSGIELEKCD